MHVLIIGGSDAGISAGLRAHELDPSAEVTIVLADDYPNFSVCGIPYFISGETPDWRALAHRTEFEGISILRRHTARRIDAAAQAVDVATEGLEQRLRYDELIVATGASPVRPEIEGGELEGVFLLRSMDDAFAVHAYLARQARKKAVLVGAGYIGLEMADALTARGVEVTLLSRSATVLPTVDPELGQLLGAELERHGVAVRAGAIARRIERAPAGSDSVLSVSDSAGRVHAADLVILAVGVRPNSEIAAMAGARVGEHGAIVVTRAMRTSLPNVLAAGDCAETQHRLFASPRYISLGTIAHKQGRVAGENAVRRDSERQFAGTLGSQGLKVFDLAIARTGIGDTEARKAGFEPLTVQTEANDHKAYYPGAVPLQLRVTGDRNTGRLLGAQILGPRQAEISKRIDVFAAALFQALTVEELNDLDLTYTPPFSSPWDPIQIAAQEWVRAREGKQRP
jgi:NADPH-dependent 2,4-dienoyl-CoA reductase/sulfur reductase-like enzyme